MSAFSVRPSSSSSSSSGEERVMEFQPWKASSKAQKFLAEALSSYLTSSGPRPVSSTPFTYTAQNDFGRKIKKLLFCQPKEGFSAHVFQNLKAIGQLEGFQVVPSDSIYSVRDVKLATAKGKILESSCSDARKKSVERTLEKNKLRQSHVAHRTKHRSFACGFIGYVAEHNMQRRTYDGIKPSPGWTNDPRGRIKDSRLYYEGGNTFFVSNVEQTPVYLIGRDLLTVTHQILRLDGFFKGPSECQSTVAYINETLTFSKWNDAINRLVLNKKIQEEVVKISDRLLPTLELSRVKETVEEMFAMGTLRGTLQLDTEAGRIAATAHAADFLAQIEFVAQRVFAEELSVQPNQIFFIPQCAYHLDYLMTPGPRGSIFLQDYHLSYQLLLDIQKHAECFHLTEKDQRQLSCFIEEADRLKTELGGIMTETIQSLEEAGLRVIPTPGAFFSHKEGRFELSEDVNFLNAISGYSEKNQRYFYIASGTNTGDRLGRCLMKVYAEFLRMECPEIAVYFVGRNPSDPHDYSEAMSVLNSPKSRLGPHCLSFELDIESHTAESIKEIGIN